MNEDLKGEASRIGGGRELGQFPEGEFAGEDGEVKALASGEGDAFGRGEGHLGGGVELYFRADGSSESDETEVLDDEGVDLGSRDLAEKPFSLGELRGEDQNIHGEVTAPAAGVEVVHDLGEVLLGKIFGPKPGIEGGESEIDRIGAGGDGGLEAVPVAGRGQKLWVSAH